MASSLPTSRAYRGLDDDDEGYKAIVDSVKRLVISKTESLKSEHRKLRERHNHVMENHYLLQLEMFNNRQAFGIQRESLLKERGKSDLFRQQVRELKLENATLKVTLADMENTLRESGVELSNDSNTTAEVDSSARLLTHRLKEMEGELRFLRIVNDEVRLENRNLNTLLEIEKLEAAQSRALWKSSVAAKQEPSPSPVVNSDAAHASAQPTIKVEAQKVKRDQRAAKWSTVTATATSSQPRIKVQAQKRNRDQRAAKWSTATATATSSQQKETEMKEEQGAEGSSGGRGEKRIIPDPSNPFSGKRVCRKDQEEGKQNVLNVLLVNLADDDDE